MAQDIDSLHRYQEQQMAASPNEKFDLSWEWLGGKAVEWAMNLGTALVILIIGFFIAKRISKMVDRMLSKKNFDESLKRFLVSMINTVLRILIIVSAMGQLGLEMTSFVALIGAAGLAIAMAFSGTLGNFAGGVMILIFRPYKVGDYIKTQGEEGRVSEIQMFNTILLTIDNKTIIIANGTVANGNITNYTTQDHRAVELLIGIAYGDDYLKAKEVLAQFCKEDDRILNDPETFIGLKELGDSSVNILVRAWCKPENYWPVYFAINERVYIEFGKNGLNIPFPQMDVHLHQTGK